MKPGIVIDERYVSAGTWMDELPGKDALAVIEYRIIDTIVAFELDLVCYTAMYFLTVSLVDKDLGPSGNNRFGNITAFKLQSDIEACSCQELKLLRRK